MKKGTILPGAVALILVAVLSVGGTLAYISATDSKVVNTFTFGSMTVELTEEEPDQVEEEVITAKPDGGGYAYSNVVPGQQLNKAPEVSVKTSASAYVFVKVEGFSASLTCAGVKEGWTAVTGTTDTYGNGVYYKTVAGNAGWQDLGTIFEKVTVADGDGTAVLPDITIKVGAIQMAGNTADTAYTAVNTAYFA